MAGESRSPDAFDGFRQFLALERDVLVLSAAMLAFSLSFQMTSRYVPEFMRVLGAGAGVIGLYGSVGNLISAFYPYPGGALSDRLGSRLSLTLFGVCSTLGFLFWMLAPEFGTVSVLGVSIPAWGWVFLGLFLAQAWDSFGLGATFAIVKQSVSPDRLATGFASTETFRRVGFLLGPLVATALLASTTEFVTGFQAVLLVAAGFAAIATFSQHRLYDASNDSLGKSFEGVKQIVADLRALPPELRPLLVGDTLVRFANGMVYVFFVIVVTDFLEVGVTAFGVFLRPDAFFGLLLGIEMVVALLVMLPAAKLARRVGLKPVVATGFLAYAIFPILLINAPANALVVAGLFAFSGLRFAGLPAHKALIVGPAKRDAGGRVTGSYYLVRNTVVIPSAALGGLLYASSPELAFAVATVVGLVGTGYFLARGEEFEPYAGTN